MHVYVACQDPFDEFVQNALRFEELRVRGANSLEAKKELQDMYVTTHGMYAAPDASMSLTQLRQSMESFCKWAIHDGHPLGKETVFIETTANFLGKSGLALQGTTVHGLGIATDPGFKLELMQKGYYPPMVGELEIPPHSVRSPALCVERAHGCTLASTRDAWSA